MSVRAAPGSGAPSPKPWSCTAAPDAAFIWVGGVCAKPSGGRDGALRRPGGLPLRISRPHGLAVCNQTGGRESARAPRGPTRLSASQVHRLLRATDPIMQISLYLYIPDRYHSLMGGGGGGAHGMCHGSLHQERSHVTSVIALTSVCVFELLKPNVRLRYF